MGEFGHVAILMPAYNEAQQLHETLLAIRACATSIGRVCVFLVDDGSIPPISARQLAEPTPDFRIVLARHAVNLGQGAALETARQLALRAAPFEVYVTMDADGQHGATDLPALAEAVRGGAYVAFGNRFAGCSNVPRARRLVLRVASLFEYAITGLSLGDAHNGFRAFSREALERVRLRQNRMAHATEIRQQIARAQREEAGGRRVVEVAVSIQYSPGSLRKGQSSLGAFSILRDLFHRYLFGELK